MRGQGDRRIVDSRDIFFTIAGRLVLEDQE
jgi:hypothetical protein